uniref:PDZ domain-containing protein n=1 Tax=Noctiluca scintillans TaxID=2966 RepID=A0A7S0ZQK6_NOCSC|mmetsp:Transcript_14621/g.40179  ORF Transcript_14621/g.40179 Transcript_14621/m.40179 type:complete len:214 (+) Transcript_14621:32-673(+)
MNTSGLAKRFCCYFVEPPKFEASAVIAIGAFGADSEFEDRGDFIVQLNRRSVDVPLFFLEEFDGKVIVTKLSQGIETEWNHYHVTDRSLLISPCDRIVSVNGETTNISRMVFDCNSSLELDLVVRHSERFRVILEKAQNRLGMSVLLGIAKTDMRVSRLEDGVVEQWNALHPENALQVGDRIVSVNDITQDSAIMLRELSCARVLHLIVMRIR